jgi:hypothetical protein
MKCQRMEFRQTGCIPPPQQQHFQSPQSYFSRHNHWPVLLCMVRYIEHLLNMRLQCEIIGNRLYSPLPTRQRSVTDFSSPLLIVHWSVTDFTSPLLIGLTFVTGSLTFVTKNLCNGCLRSPLPEVHIGNGRCGGQPRGRPDALIGNGRQTTTVTDVGGCYGR